MADMLASGQTLKFTDPGDMHTFVLDRIDERSDADPQGNVKTWPDGTDKTVFVFSGREIDDAGHIYEDTVQVWVRGHMFIAVKRAASKLKLVTQEQMIGRKITIKFTGLGEQKTKGFAQPKLFAAKIETLQGVSAKTDMLDDGKGSTTEDPPYDPTESEPDPFAKT